MHRSMSEEPARIPSNFRASWSYQLPLKLQSVGCEFGGEAQNAGVVVVMAELRAGLLIDDEGHVGMKLQRGGGDARGDGTFDGLGDGAAFGRR